MKKLIIGALVTGSLVISLAGVASADSGTNPTTEDQIGWCVTNHIDGNGPGAIGDVRRGNEGAVADQNADVRSGAIDCRTQS